MSLYLQTLAFALENQDKKQISELLRSPLAKKLPPQVFSECLEIANSPPGKAVSAEKFFQFLASLEDNFQTEL